MEWLIAIIAGTGIGGVVTLGIYIARLAVQNRQDLHKLIQANKDVATQKETIKDLQNDLNKKTDELEREQEALAIAVQILENTVADTTASGVRNDLNRALRVLSKMSAAKDPEHDTVHETTTSETSDGVSIPASER